MKQPSTQRVSAPRLLVVMGVSACGKSSFGAAMAARLGVAFVDGDDLHPRHNIDKMRAGLALDDADRLPWLDAIGAALADRQAHPQGLVLACSALKRAYRARIRAGAAGLRFIFLDIDEATAARRCAARPDHFMPASLVASQFAALERPLDDEPDVLTIPATLALAAAVDLAASRLAGAD